MVDATNQFLDMLVVFSTQFGRTSFAQGTLKTNFGRDHHGGNFCVFMAGAGVKAGTTCGETDDFGYNIVKDPVHIHDVNATLLHILGIDHLTGVAVYVSTSLRAATTSVENAFGVKTLSASSSLRNR